MKNFTIDYTVIDDLEEYSWTGSAESIADALAEFYLSEEEFDYETPMILNITELN